VAAQQVQERAAASLSHAEAPAQNSGAVR
jgi:hypothetical protein